MYLALYFAPGGVFFFLFILFSSSLLLDMSRNYPVQVLKRRKEKGRIKKKAKAKELLCVFLHSCMKCPRNVGTYLLLPYLISSYGFPRWEKGVRGKTPRRKTSEQLVASHIGVFLGVVSVHTQRYGVCSFLGVAHASAARGGSSACCLFGMSCLPRKWRI